MLEPGKYASKTLKYEFYVKNQFVEKQYDYAFQILFYDRGFATFDAIRKFEVHLHKDVWYNNNSEGHMKASTLKVKEALESGALTENDLANWIHESHALKGETLTASELTTKVGKMREAIINGDAKAGEFTWHHHQETGRMELIPTWIHKAVSHSGGNSLWPRNPLIKGR